MKRLERSKMLGKKVVSDRCRFEFGRIIKKDGDGYATWNSHCTIGNSSKRLPLEEGPYADKDGVVASLTKEIKIASNGRTRKAVDILIDVLRPVNLQEDAPRFEIPNLKFHFSVESFRQSSKLPTPGEILCSKRDDNNAITITDPVEIYNIAISIIRRMGFDAERCVSLEDFRGKTNMPMELLISIPATSGGIVFSTNRKKNYSRIHALEFMDDCAVLSELHLVSAENELMKLLRQYEILGSLLLNTSYGRELEEFVRMISQSEVIVFTTTGNRAMLYSDLMNPQVAVPVITEYLGISPQDGVLIVMELLRQFEEYKTYKKVDLTKIVDEIANSIAEAEELWPGMGTTAKRIFNVLDYLSFEEMGVFLRILDRKEINLQEMEGRVKGF